MIHPTPTKVLLAPTLQPLVGQLSGSLAHGARRIAPCLPQAPTPQQMATFAKALRALLREVGRRSMAWVLNHMEPEGPAKAPSRLWWQGTADRRRRKQRTSIATLFGPVVVWRRLYAPLAPGLRSIHPLALHVGMEAGVATPALAKRIGGWAADHSQRQVLDMVHEEHGVQWACTTLRQLLGRLSAGMAQHRHAAQVDQVVSWLHQARASTGRFQPTLAVGRAGVNGPMRQGEWKEGSTATGSVLDRRGTRLRTGSLGQRPESGQTTLSTPSTALLQDILSQVDSASLRLVSISDDGYHPRADYHNTLKTMPAPQRSGRKLTWIRIVDSYHVCLYIKPLAEAVFGPGAKGRAWAKQMRKQMKTTADGMTRVLQAASALQRQNGLWGKPKGYTQAYTYLKKRTHWMRYRHSSSQRLPIGSGITEAAWKTVCAQRLKRSGRSWTIEGGHVIVDLRVIWLSGVWDEVHQRYLASKPMPVTRVAMVKGAQLGQQPV